MQLAVIRAAFSKGAAVTSTNVPAKPLANFFARHAAGVRNCFAASSVAGGMLSLFNVSHANEQQSEGSVEWN